MSREEFAKAKRRACEALTVERVLPPFRAYLYKRFGIPNHRVRFDHEDAIRRIGSAMLMSHTESEQRWNELYGETDGDGIWIMRNMSFEDQVSTLMHEALHDSVHIERVTRSSKFKGIDEENEHIVMRAALNL